MLLAVLLLLLLPGQLSSAAQSCSMPQGSADSESSWNEEIAFWMPWEPES